MQPYFHDFLIIQIMNAFILSYIHTIIEKGCGLRITFRIHLTISQYMIFHTSTHHGNNMAQIWTHSRRTIPRAQGQAMVFYQKINWANNHGVTLYWQVTHTHEYVNNYTAWYKLYLEKNIKHINDLVKCFLCDILFGSWVSYIRELLLILLSEE